MGYQHFETKQKFLWQYLNQEQHAKFLEGNAFSIKWQIHCFMEFRKIVDFRKNYMLKFRALKVQFKNVFLIMKEHVHSIVKKANFHLLYTFILNILFFWARKTDNDTVSAFKISITVHVIISRVLLHFATFQKSHHTPKNMPICQHPLSSVARWIFSSPAFLTWTLSHCLKSF